MELKDIVLSTIAEIDEISEHDNIKGRAKDTTNSPDTQDTNHLTLNEEYFLKNLRERILVLFEGLKTPNNQNIEVKIDLTLNFLEYLLATIDDRLKEKNNS